MKYFLIILFSFIVAFPAYAAKTVQGTVPNFPPLQPPAAHVSPNYSHNIEAGSGLPAAPAAAGIGGTSGSGQSGNASSVSASQSPQPAARSYGWWILAMILVLAAAGGFWRYRSKRQQP